MSVFNAKSDDSTDLYGTPTSATDLLLPYLKPELRYWEPCRGYGAIEKHLKLQGFNFTATDISTGQDALIWQPEGWDACVTNPPWSLKTQFLQRFYDLGKPFALLLPCDLVNGKRTALFAEHGLQLIVPSWRVRFMRFDGEKAVEATSPNTGSAWFCWKMGLPKDLNFVTR